MISYYDRSTKKLIEGKLFKIPKFCKEKYSAKCEKFYEGLCNNGHHICPYGFSTYLSSSDDMIYTGLVVKGKSDFKKIKPKIINDKLQSVESEFLQKCISINSEYIFLKHTDELILNIMHELKKLSSLILRQNNDNAVFLDELVLNQDDILEYIQKLRNRNDNINAANNLLSIRWRSYDYWKNPSLYHSKVSIYGVYKKFEKASHCLEVISANKMRCFSGVSYSNIEADETFELLPFILLENATKYTPEGKNIKVEFNESTKAICVSITNVGPFAEEEEISKLFNKGVRGEASKLIKDIEGFGLGLSIAKDICTRNKITIELSSDKSKKYKVDGIPFAPFNVYLEFPIHHRLT